MSNDRKRALPNYTLEYLKKHGIPLTLENYLAVEYLGEPPAELSPEVEAELPAMFRCGEEDDIDNAPSAGDSGEPSHSTDKG